MLRLIRGYFIIIFILFFIIANKPLLAGFSIEKQIIWNDFVTPTAFPLPTQVFPIVSVPEAADPGSFMPDIGELMAETDHLYVYSEYGYLPVELEWFVLEAEQVFASVSTRLQTTIDYKIPIIFERPPLNALGCPSRGVTLTSPVPDAHSIPVIIIYADTHTSREQILGILAHEIGHILHYSSNDHRLASSDRALNEGLATWAAGQYWARWQGAADFDTNVRTYIENNEYLSLHENYDLQRAYSGDTCIESRDILYTEWASFIDFLIREYGASQFEDLLRSPKRQIVELPTGSVFELVPADFTSVYGLALNQLEVLWFIHIQAQAES